MNPKTDHGSSRAGSVLGTVLVLAMVLRDWYTRNGVCRTALYDLADASGPRWEDLSDGAPLTVDEILGLRHCAMSVLYDDRIRDAAPRMTGVPEGSGEIFPVSGAGLRFRFRPVFKRVPKSLFLPHGAYSALYYLLQCRPRPGGGVFQPLDPSRMVCKKKKGHIGNGI